MDLETIKNAISTLQFKDYESIQELICLPDGCIENDPLNGRVKNKDNENKTKQHNKIRFDYLDSFLFCFFSRFNTKYDNSDFHKDYHKFKKVFLDELRNGAMRNWKVSTNKRDKGIILGNIEKGKIDKYTLQWISDFYNITIIIDEREYIPRKDKVAKPLMKLKYCDDGYKLN